MNLFPAFYTIRLTLACKLILLLLFLSTLLFAEGTKQLVPNQGGRVYLYTNATVYNDFGRYNGTDGQRLYIHIENPNTEQVFLGFSRPVSSGHHPCNGSTAIDGYFRIKDPTGRVVYPIKDNPNGQVLNATTSNITTYNQAVAGPKPINGATGYTPFVFNPTGLPAGDYYVEFSRVINTVSLNNPMPIEWFDITVATKTPAPSAINGRLFARNWALFSPSISCGTNANYTWFDRAFNGTFFVYTNENIVTEVDFNSAGFQAAAFNAVFNDAGTTRTGDVIEDRKSRDNIRSSAAQHRIFLHDPDINVYPTGVLGQFSSSPVYFACENGTACVEVVATEPGQIGVLVDLDRTSGNFIYDDGTKDVLIAFKIDPLPNEKAPYIRCIPWDGLDGLGNPVPDIEDITNIAMLVRYAQGIYHFPIYDAEYMVNGFDVTTIRPLPNNGSPKKVYYDDSNIPNNYGVGINIPNINPFNGCNTPCHYWTNYEFGNLNTINTWYFAREEYVRQVDVGGCPISAINDTTKTPANMAKIVDVLRNDIGIQNIDTVSIGLATNPNNGIATFDSLTFQVNYTPNPGFIGLDSFNYEFCYGILPVRSLCDVALVVITVESRPEDCQNIYDDDGDGLADCDDPDCLPATPVIRRKKGKKN